MSKVRVELLSDTSAAIAIGDAPAEPLDAKEVTALVGALVAARAGMAPPAVAGNPKPDDLVLSSPGQMRWHLSATPNQERPVALLIGHPGLGWTALTLTERGLESMVARLGQALRHVRGLPPE